MLGLRELETMLASGHREKRTSQTVPEDDAGKNQNLPEIPRSSRS